MSVDRQYSIRRRRLRNRARLFRAGIVLVILALLLLAFLLSGGSPTAHAGSFGMWRGARG
jgi:hypothetical protein